MEPFVGRPSRAVRRALALVVAFALVETLAIGLFVGRARAFVLSDPAQAHARSSSAPSGSERPNRALEAPDHGRERETVRHLTVEIDRAAPITARPGGGRVVGTMPAGSRYYRVPVVAWVRNVSRDGRYGLVDVPFVAERRAGWIRIRGLDTGWTRISVRADLSEHRITVLRGERVVFRAPAATGAPASPTPTGRYFVTDRVSFPGGGALGTFAFGISGIQPDLPPGWSGGDQLAIHGTNAPWSIGRSASAGCLRVSETVLDRLRPLLRLGTPVVVHP